jgi:hypothetical protein
VTSTDRAQVSHVIHVLDRLLSSLNPINLVTSLVTAIEAIALPPPGDPAALRTLAGAFTTAGERAGQLAADVRALGGRRLPAVWTGMAGASAQSVVLATGDLVDAVPAAFAIPARALGGYADTVEALRARHHELHQRLYAAWHDATSARVLGIAVPALDVTALARLVGRAVELLEGCRGIYRESLSAAEELEGHLADATGRARAQTDLRLGRPPANAVLLADAALGSGLATDNAILGPAQAERAADLRARLSPADQARLDALLAGAGSPAEQAYLLKAFAAGHTVDEVAAFATQIHGRDPDWLREHLSLVDPTSPGAVSYRGFAVEQTDNTTCGSTSILLARAMTDPIYALGLTTGGQPDDATQAGGDAFYARLRAEEQRIHDATNTVWPQQLGTSPWGAADGLNQSARELGTTYDWRVVDDTDSRSVDPALRDAVTAVDHGYPVPVLIGDSYPAHYVLLIGHDGDDLVFYNPSGEVTRIGQEQFLGGKVDDLGYPHVQGVITPAR